jgi:hypothetical protein
MPNRIYDYARLEKDFVTSFEDVSIHELARRNKIRDASSVHRQARKRDLEGLNWYDKRDLFKQEQHRKLIDKVAGSRAAVAAKEAAVFEKAVDAIELAIDQLSKDLKAGKITVKPSDLALLIDRMNVLFNRPSTITEGRNIGLSVNADATPDEFKRILELTSGVAGRDLGSGSAGSTLPRTEGPRSN